jgi:hypothetical protein
MESSLFIAFFAALNAPSTMCSPRALATRARRLKPAPGNQSGTKRTFGDSGHVMTCNKRCYGLRTCWENVDQETAGDDGILDNLVGLARELYILSNICARSRSTGTQGEETKKTKKTCLGVGRGDPDAVRIFDDVFAECAASISTWSIRVGFGRLWGKQKTRRVLADCTDVIVRVYEELLEEQTRVRELAGEERERGGTVETLLRNATHRLPVFPIWREHNAWRKVHPNDPKKKKKRRG